MKKIFAALMSAAMILVSAAGVFAAGELSSVSVTTPKGTPESKTFPSGTDGNIYDFDITDMLTELDSLTATKDIVQDITISSASATSLPINYWLELELPEKSGYAPADTYTAVDYYSVRIANERGTVIYDDEEANAPTGETLKRINLGTLNNNKNRSDEETYKIYVSVNDEVNTSQLSDSPSDVVWKLAYTDDTDEFEPTPSPAVSNTAAPTTPSVSNTTAPSARATATAAPTPTAPAKTITVAVTKDDDVPDSVTPGSYRLEGSGHVVITDSNGNKKAEFDLTTSNSQSVTTLREGDKVTVTGPNGSYVQFRNPTATATPRAAARATARPTSTPRRTTRPTATATAKANPKTGDNAPIIGVSVVAGMALAAVVYIGITSKKNKNNK